MPKVNAVVLILLFSLILLCLTAVSCGGNAAPSPPQAVNGVIDLANWDFEKDGPVRLQGEWKFIWDDWQEDFTNPGFDDSGWKTLTVPKLWNEEIPPGKEFGYGCLRLTIRHVSGNDIGLLLQNAYSSYVMYANGRPILKAGRVGATRETTVAHMITHIASVPESGTIVLAWHVANFDQFYAGILTHPLLGPKQALNSAVTAAVSFDMFIMGIILMMGLYHFMLWFMRRDDKTNIFFVLFSLMILLRGITANFYPENIFPNLSIHQLNIKLYIITVGLAWIFFYFFLRELFPGETSKKVALPMLVICAAALLFVAVTPVWVFTTVYLVYALLLFIGVGYSLFIVILAIIRKREGSVWLLVGVGILCIASVNDVIHYYIPNVSVFLIQNALVGFIFIKSIVLSQRYASALRTAEYLTSHLHKEVAIKTQTIEKQNEKLRELDREKTDYLMNISHEIKTPLTLISNYLDKYIKEKGVNRDSEIIRSNMTKLTADVVNFMDFEKLNHNMVFYNHGQIICLSDVLRDIVDLFKETAKRKKIALRADIKKNLHIQADPSAIERIVNNLIDNGMKYSKETGGEIRITLSAADSLARLTIQDTGIGIQEKNLEKIFRPYYQISHAKRNIQGLGMGLPIVKRIVEALGGAIGIESVQDEGTTVSASFPLAMQEGRKKKAAEAPAAGILSSVSPSVSEPVVSDSSFHSSRQTVLVVEDNADMARFLCGNLSERYNVFEAANGKEALEKLSLIPRPDVILSDIMMDEMDGHEFFERIHDLEDFKHIPFVFLTAKTSEASRKKGLEDGAIDYICKPFGIEELKLKIESIIRLCQSQRAESQIALEHRILNAIRNKEEAGVQYENLDRQCVKYRISDREKEVLRHVFLGKENKEIAVDLNISYSTVATHFQSILRKCDVHNKVDLINLFRPNQIPGGEKNG